MESSDSLFLRSLPIFELHVKYVKFYLRCLTYNCCSLIGLNSNIERERETEIDKKRERGEKKKR